MDSRAGLLQPVLADGVASCDPLKRHEPEAHEQLQAGDTDTARLGSHDRIGFVAGGGQHPCQLRGVCVAAHRVEGDDGPPAHVVQVGLIAEWQVVGLVEQALQHGGGFRVFAEQASDVADELVSPLLALGAVHALEALVTHLRFGLVELPLAEQPVGVVPLEVQPKCLRRVVALQHGCAEVRVAHDVIRVQVHGGHDGVRLGRREVVQLVEVEPNLAGMDASQCTVGIERVVHQPDDGPRVGRRLSRDRVVGHFSPRFPGWECVVLRFVLSSELKYNIFEK